MKKTQIVIVIIVILAIIAGYVYFFILGKGEKIKEKVGIPSVDPLENLPSANPYEGTKMNPLEDVYKNPFE
jgi:flagellar basal body-associated protein FliL